MNVQLPKDIECKKVAWTIKDFSKSKPNKVHLSEVFTVGNVPWKLMYIMVTEEHPNWFLTGLEVLDTARLPEGWNIYVEFTFAVISQVSKKLSVIKALKHQFCAKQELTGECLFTNLNEFYNPQNGYILNDKCIIELEFFVLRSENIGTEPTSHLVTSNCELVDFRDLGQIEKALIPLLDEVCSWHPSLIQCQKKRTRKFTECAFTALGRVLQFLKTKKAKDMTEEACEQLQQSWEELKIFRFDLAWLEPFVQFALGVKAYRGKTENVKKLKEDLVVLEAEKKRLAENVKKLEEDLVVLEANKKKLMEKLADTEENAERIRKDLVKQEEGFEEIDMDAQIGYGTPLVL